MDILKMDLTGAIESLNSRGFNRYDQMTHFVSCADEFVTFFEGVAFTPSAAVGRLYFQSTGVGLYGHNSNADVAYLMEHNAEEVEQWFNNHKANMINLFMDIAFSSISQFRSIMGRSRYNSDSRSDDYLQTISDILDKDDPLAELSIVGVIDVKEGFKEGDEGSQGNYNYHDCQTSRALANEIHGKLRRLLNKQGLEQNIASKIVFTTLHLLFGGVAEYKNDYLESVLKREFGTQRNNPEVFLEKIIVSNDISVLWDCVGSETKKDNPDVFNSVLFIINMMVLCTLLKGESITHKKRDGDCDSPRPVTGRC